VRVQLDDIAYRVPAGHRLRLAISTSYWPVIWPSPEPVTLTVQTEGSRISLPIRKGGATGPEIEPMALAEQVNLEILQDPVTERRICRDLVSGEVMIHAVDDTGLKRIPSHGIEFRTSSRENYAIRDDDPLSARMSAHWVTETARGEWRVRTESSQRMWSDRTSFHLEAELIGFEGEREVFRRNWQRVIKRNGI